MNIIDKDIKIICDGIEIDSKIIFSVLKKKRSDSPTESEFYEIINLPTFFFKKIGRDASRAYASMIAGTPLPLDIVRVN